MKRALWLACAALLGWLAWLAWQPPASVPPVLQVHAPVPAPMPETAQGKTGPGQADGQALRLWRVVTHRFVWKQAARTLHKQLADAGLRVIVIARKEDVELHAFDDIRLFSRREEALKAKRAWEEKGFDASLIRPDDTHFGVALGRLYLAAYARRLQARLATSGMRYRYERRLVHIPTWRFTFPPAPKPEAEQLWQRIQQMGVAEPALMPEREFRKLYADALATRSANRSNK